MEAAFKTVMVAVVVALCGALPTTSPSQEELLTARVNMNVNIFLCVLAYSVIISCDICYFSVYEYQCQNALTFLRILQGYFDR